MNAKKPMSGRARRRQKGTIGIEVRLSLTWHQAVRIAADADGRSMSSWMARAAAKEAGMKL